MLRMIAMLLLGTLLTSCSLLHVHKMDIEQGNIINPEMVRQLRTWMSQSQVRALMGNPVLVNTFSPNQLDYVYTMQRGHQQLKEQRIILSFHNDALVGVNKGLQ